MTEGATAKSASRAAIAGTFRCVYGWLAPALLAALLGGPRTAMTATVAAPQPAPPPAVVSDAQPPFQDLPQIRWLRKLRVLVPGTDSELGRNAELLRLGRELLTRFAAEQDLRIDWLKVENWNELIPALEAGRGDIIGAGLTVTEPRKQRIEFTLPLRTVREQMIVRVGDRIDDPAALRGREVVLRERSSFWDVLQGLRRSYPEIGVRLVPENTTTKALLAGVERGVYDIAVVDRREFQRVAKAHPTLKLVPGFAGGNAVAWGVSPRAPHLLAALNDFLQREQLARPIQRVYKDDLPGIERRGVLRVLTRNNATDYFLWRGRQAGFEFELMKRFAASLKLRLEMIVAPSRRHLVPMLLWGGGDVIAAGLTVSKRREKLGMRFSKPYGEIREVLIARADETGIKLLSDLARREVVVRRSSSYWQTLSKMIEQGATFALRPAPEDMETEEIIARVASGDFDLTVANSNLLGAELTWRDDIKGVLDLKGPVGTAWAVRKDDEQLLKALNDFVAKERNGLFFNITYERYFKNRYRIRKHIAQRADGDGAKGSLSPYDALVRRLAERHGFDWRLIVAQIYQESRFDPKVTSPAGAGGLLQVLPATAARYRITDLSDPAQGLEAGLRYLSWIHGKFSPELSVKDRMWFTLAAYNAGLGHVLDARALARRLNLDPNAWFGNVEKAMRLLTRRKYYRRAAHGYVRGGQSVIYVRDIRDRYQAYVRLTHGPG